MTTNNDGGPAFPERYQSGSHVQGDGRCQFTVPTLVDKPGMSLRDWFAGQALASIPDFSEMSSYRIQPGPAEEIATTAYALADAMLKAREASNA